jgi:hypothetical protein
MDDDGLDPFAGIFPAAAETLGGMRHPLICLHRTQTDHMIHRHMCDACHLI